MPSAESLKILQMIEQGQITAEEGVRLLTAAQAASPNKTVVAEAPAHAETPEQTPTTEAPPAAEQAPAPEHASPSAPVPARSSGGGWFRIRVTDMKTNRSKVTVNLPLSLMAAGLKIGAHYAPELKDMNLAEVFKELRDTQPGKIVDVMDDEDGEHVEIFVE